jgi:hypothetical protein
MPNKFADITIRVAYADEPSLLTRRDELLAEINERTEAAPGFRRPDRYWKCTET